VGWDHKCVAGANLLTSCLEREREREREREKPRSHNSFKSTLPRIYLLVDSTS
jgi:hypothetical protein